MFFGLNDVAFLAAVAGGAALDPDAAAYIAAVEAADTQALEPAVRAAINDFVVGCKADGIWNAIKASCILAGARTLTGALVPLVGAAPTNFNFVSGDYNRKTGLVGNGSTKYLDSNRNNNADPQDSNHNAVFATAASTSTGRIISAGAVEPGVNSIVTFTPPPYASRNRSSASFSHPSASTSGTGLMGTSRQSSSEYVFQVSGNSATLLGASQTPLNANILIYQGGGSFYSNARIAFYSIGESLDLALLDARVTALINAFDAAI